MVGTIEAINLWMWEEGHPTNKNLLQYLIIIKIYLWVDNWLMVSGRVNSCKVSPEVVYPGQMSDPTLAWEK